jgi:acetylornithine/succinyldiaminopimelate/putrescine aminotransferase
LLSAGTHGTTYGGSPLACAVALKVLEVIDRESLADNVRRQGEALKSGLQELAARYPSVIRTVRGLGLMLGVELAPDITKLPGDPQKTQSVRFVMMLHAAGVLTIPAGTQVVRLLPPLNISSVETEQALRTFEQAVVRLAS